MSANILKERLRAGKACINGWLTLPSPFVAEAMAQTGWDSLTIDIQHGLLDYQSAVSLIQAIQRFPVTPLVRVPVNEPGIIGKVLDAGAWGVICPMVNTVDEARAFAQACHYPARSARSARVVTGVACPITTSRTIRYSFFRRLKRGRPWTMSRLSSMSQV
jgi:4-hydroxy-2-oxoheptanedioate aldolase